MKCSVTIVLAICCVAATSAVEKKKVVLPKPKPIAGVENNVGKTENSKGEKFLEGDMIKPNKDKKEGSDRNAKVAGENGQNRWPTSNGIVTVPYTFSSAASAKAKQQFLDAAADYAAWTCIKFVQRSSEKDYIEVINDDGCYSYVGRTGGKQPLSLGPGCEYDKGTSTHEMMHALGFDHEQSRPDRDQHVTIVQSNVEPSNFYNFEKCSDCTTPGDIPYDYTSVMHYDGTAFSMNGQKTIIPKKSEVTKLGQRAGLCDLDIKKLNWMYKCGTKTASSTKPNGGAIPCKVEHDNWSNCADFKDYCASPDNDYEILENCPITCAGVKKGDPVDLYSNCADFKDSCDSDPSMKTDCAATCAKA